MHCNFIVYIRSDDLGPGDIKEDDTARGPEPIYCHRVRRISSKRIECDFPKAKGRTDGCAVKAKIYLRIAGQTYQEPAAPKLCFDTPGLLGLETAFTISEGSSQNYKLKLKHPIRTGTLTVDVKSSNPKCMISPTQLILTKDSTDADKTITIASNFTEPGNPKIAKDFDLAVCDITHTMSSTDRDLAYFITWSDNPETLEAKIKAQGCGDGEYLGLDIERPGENKDLCVCSNLHYSPANGTVDCAVCPSKQSKCVTKGMTNPETLPDFWREPGNLTLHPFHKCPYEGACLGGDLTNRTTNPNGRCREGHDNFGPVCATCELGYIISGDGVCTPCPTYDPTVFVNPGMIGLVIVMLLGLCIFVFHFITKSALTKEIRKGIEGVLMDEDAHANLLALIEAHPEKSLSLKDFMEFMSTLEEEPLYLTRPEAMIIFSEMDTGSVEENEARRLDQINSEGKQDDTLKSKIKNKSTNALKDAMDFKSGGARAVHRRFFFFLLEAVFDTTC